MPRGVRSPAALRRICASASSLGVAELSITIALRRLHDAVGTRLACVRAHLCARRREFAWEYLRRDPSYKRDYHAVAHRLAAHLCLLNAWRARAIGKVLDHAFTKRRAAVRFTNDEMFVANSLPFDRLPATKRMVLREHDKQTARSKAARRRNRSPRLHPPQMPHQGGVTESAKCAH